jgi:hypothetical protein
MRQHVTLLGAFLIAHSALSLLLAMILFISIAGGGMLSGDATAIAITGTLAAVLAGFFVLLALPGLIAGIGLLRGKKWARVLGLIVCILSLLSIPLGTALGIYGIWVLTRDETNAQLV